MTPSPIRRQMEPIPTLLYTEAAANLEHRNNAYDGERINIENVIKVLSPIYNGYCERMPGTKCHLGCPKQITLRYDHSQHSLFLEPYQFNERVVYCTSKNDCMYYAEGKRYN